MAVDALRIAEWVINKESGRVECKRCPYELDLSPGAGDIINNATFNNGVWFSVGWLLEAIVRDGHDCG